MGVLSSGSCCAMDWIIVGSLLLGILYLYLTWTYGHWRKHGVPYVEPVLLFGCVKESVLAKKTLGELYQDFYWKLAGHSYGGFFKFRQPAVLLRDPDLIKTVLVKDFSSFHDNDFQVSQDVDPMMGRNPFVVAGERWKVVRTQLSPALTVSRVKVLFPLMQDVCRDLVTFLEKETGPQHPDGLEAKELAAKYTTDVVASCVFGVCGNSFRDPDAEFRKMGKLVLEPGLWKGLQHTCIILAPRVADFFKFRFISEEVANFFRRMMKELVAYREENNVKRNDVMEALIQLKTSEKGNEGYTNEDLAGHASTFFTEGFETSSTVMSFTLYELAMNPEVQRQLREELDGALKEDGELTFDTVNSLPYLDMVISESMRKHPPAMFINRLCTKPFTLPTPSGGTVTVDVGTSTVVPVLALHSDPQYYPDPERFIPERFTDTNKQARNKYTYLPFGEGPRICMGMRFAMAQTKLGVATVVSQFDIKKTRRTCSRVQPHPNYFLRQHKDGLWINLVKRSDK